MTNDLGEEVHLRLFVDRAAKPEVVKVNVPGLPCPVESFSRGQFQQSGL